LGIPRFFKWESGKISVFLKKLEKFPKIWKKIDPRKKFGKWKNFQNSEKNSTLSEKIPNQLYVDM
jgi:hypothetical protein